MSTNPISVALLGLGRIGASLGLALKGAAGQKGARQTFSLTGWDSRGATAEAAHRRGAVDALAPGLAAAVVNRDVVVLTLPYSEVQAAYRTIAPALRPGAVVLDASPLKLPSQTWADKYLTPETPMVGITPVVGFAHLFSGPDDPEHADADLFSGGSLVIAPGPRAAREAVELASDLAALIGTTPRFIDPAEHDGFVAVTEALPALLGAAAFYAVRQEKSWDDTQRLTNPNFGRLTHGLLDTHPDDLRDLLLNNRDNTVHHLDSVLRTLTALREAIALDRRDALEAALIGAAEDYRAWARRRGADQWDDTPQGPPAKPSMMSSLLGDALARRLRGDRSDGA